MQELIEKTELGNEDIESNLEIEVTNEAAVIIDNCIAVQTDLSFDMIEQDVVKLQCKIEELKRENQTLKQTVKQLESELVGTLPVNHCLHSNRF